MAQIPGTSGNDPLAGTSDDDTITSGGGRDTITADAGNDRIVLDGVVATGTSIDGGPGTDTIEVRNLASPGTLRSPIFPDGIGLSSHSLLFSSITSIEALNFQSASNTAISLALNYGGDRGNQVTGAGITQLTGGAGLDIVGLIASYLNPSFQSLEVFAPSFSYTDWTTPTRAYQAGDRVNLTVSLSGQNAASVNLTVHGAAHTGILSLTGGLGNDTIHGSADMDFISATAGQDKLYGNGGNDTLAFYNLLNVRYDPPGVITSVTQTFLPSAGTLFDGGEGFDFLAIGGPANFQGTVVGIEGLYLAPSYGPVTPPLFPAITPVLDTAQLTISSTTLAQFPTGLEIDGVGTIVVELDPGVGFNGAGYVFTPGAAVAFEVRGSAAGDAITGTALGDLITGEDGNDTLTGGSGADVFAVSFGEDVITDFTQGQDRIDLSKLGVSGLTGVAPFLTQSGADAVFAVTFGGIVNSLTLRNVQIGQLTDADFVLSSSTEDRLVEGTPLADMILGQGGDDDLRGGGGADTIAAGAGDDFLVGGRGSDLLSGGTGADTFVADGGADVITDFTPGTDLLDLSGLGITSFAALAGSIGQVGADTVISITLNLGRPDPDAPRTITLRNVQATAFDADDFIFAVENGQTSSFGTQGDDFLFGFGGFDFLIGQEGNDTLLGGAGNDTIIAGLGNDVIDGGAGFDVLVADGMRSDFVITREGFGFRLIDQRSIQPNQGSDFAINVDTFQFHDGIVNANQLIPTVPPIAAGDVGQTQEDTPVVLAVLANDSDADQGALTVSSASDPAHGTAAVNSNGTVTYTPDANYFGQDSFTYTISDGQGGTANATVTVNVDGVEDAPDATDDSARINYSAPLIVAVLANDIDGDGDSLTVTAASDPANGTAVINGNGTITYTPDVGYRGTDSFTYTISDGKGVSDTATVSLAAPIVPTAQTVLTSGQSYGVQGFPDLPTDVFITGTAAGAEVLTIGDFTTAGFSNNFAGGGDTIRVTGLASDFAISVSGNQVSLTSTVNQTTLNLPVGFNAMTLVFETAASVFNDSRSLRFVADGGDVDLQPDLFLGTQRIMPDVTAVAVLAFA